MWVYWTKGLGQLSSGFVTSDPKPPEVSTRIKLSPTLDDEDDYLREDGSRARRREMDEGAREMGERERE